MIGIDAFSELLQILYSAPLQRGQWQRFLTLVSNHTRSSSGFFISANEQSQLRVLAAGGAMADNSFVPIYNENFAQNDPFRTSAARNALSRNPIGVFSESDLLPEDGLLKTSLYTGLLAQVNLRYAAIMILTLTVRCLDAVSLWRTVSEGPIDPDSRRLLELLLPHIQTALDVNRRLRFIEQGLSAGNILADANPVATFILDGKGIVHYWNTAAQAIVRARDGIKVKNGQLVSDEQRSGQVLKKLISDASSPHTYFSGAPFEHAMRLPRTSGKRPLQIIASPLPEYERHRTGGEVLLLISDPDKAVYFTDEVLRALYGFTSAEAEIANGLLIGYSAEEIACLRRVSPGTVRQQIKSMLGKTDVSRQSDMVRLFMTLPTNGPKP
jgi:DNA-binding CsgD family transcriptional regulator/PAS domain-containing protein